VRNLLLDFGGVCLRNPVELHRELERALGLPPNTFTWMGPIDPSTDPLWRQLLAGEISEPAYWQQRARDVGDAAQRGSAWTLQDYIRVCFDLPETTIIRDGARAIVADVRAAGGKVGILTNDLLAFHGQGWVDSIAFLRDMTSITDAAKLGVMKPDPRAYAQALADLGVGKDDVVFVDDQPRNVVGGRAFGLTTVAFDVAHPDASWAQTRRLLGMS